MSDGVNAFMPLVVGEDLSQLGPGYLGGLKEHACDAAVLASSTIKGSRRYRPFFTRVRSRELGTGQPRRHAAGPSRRGAERDPHRERVGEPTANRYLYLASKLFTELDSIRCNIDPGPSADAPFDLPPTLFRVYCRKCWPACEPTRCSRHSWGQASSPSCEGPIGCFGCSPGEVLRDWKSPNPQSTQDPDPDEHP